MAGKKSVSVAYFLWLTLGALGAHHLYLGRRRHAFAMWATVGGFFGIGWLRDLTKISDYVWEANESESYRRNTWRRRETNEVPIESTARVCGKILFSYAVGTAFFGAFPEDWYTKDGSYLPRMYLAFATHVVIGLAVQFLSNTGEYSTPSWSERGGHWSLIGSLLAFAVWPNHYVSVFYGACASAITVNNRGIRWSTEEEKKERRGKARWKDVGVYVVGVLLYTGMWTSLIYYNGSITDNDGSTVKIRDALTNFLNSEAWLDTKEAVARLYNYYHHNGWSTLFWTGYDTLMEYIDPQGENHSFKVLGLRDSSTQDEISKKYRQLVRQFHPDKVRDPQEKEKATERFMEIQKAYQTLNKILNRRMKKQAHRKEEDVQEEGSEKTEL